MSERQLDIFKENGIFWTSIKASEFVHKRDNNSESQAHLDENRDHFNGKCLLLLKKLCAGERLLFCDEVIHRDDPPEVKERKVGDLRRRSRDLIEAGIPVQRTWIKGLSKVKEYYLKPEDIIWIKKIYFK